MRHALRDPATWEGPCLGPRRSAEVSRDQLRCAKLGQSLLELGFATAMLRHHRPVAPFGLQQFAVLSKSRAFSHTLPYRPEGISRRRMVKAFGGGLLIGVLLRASSHARGQDAALRSRRRGSEELRPIERHDRQQQRKHGKCNETKRDAPGDRAASRRWPGRPYRPPREVRLCDSHARARHSIRLEER